MVTAAITRLAQEPPFRLFARAVLNAQRERLDLETRMRWDLSDRPAYLLGMGRAALEAKQLGITQLCVCEFGVASGNGLLIMQREAAAITRETGVALHVVGFDTGVGLPAPRNDWRVMRDFFRPSDFAMDEAALRARLAPSTELIIGDIAETWPRFVRRMTAPLGFLAIDVDYYTSTVPILNELPRAPMLPHTPVYLDDLMAFVGCHATGELAAVDEFNRAHAGSIYIGPWLGVRRNRPYTETAWLDGMFVAHRKDLVESVRLERASRVLPLRV